MDSPSSHHCIEESQLGSDSPLPISTLEAVASPEITRHPLLRASPWKDSPPAVPASQPQAREEDRQGSQASGSISNLQRSPQEEVPVPTEDGEDLFLGHTPRQGNNTENTLFQETPVLTQTRTQTSVPGSANTVLAETPVPTSTTRCPTSSTPSLLEGHNEASGEGQEEEVSGEGQEDVPAGGLTEAETQVSEPKQKRPRRCTRSTEDKVEKAKDYSAKVYEARQNPEFACFCVHIAHNDFKGRLWGLPRISI